MSQQMLKIVLFTLFGLWAGFWSWFSIASVAGEPGGWGHLFLPLVPIIVSAVLLVRKPRVGGVVLASLGVAGLFFYGFKFFVTWAGLSTPAIVLGIAFAIVGAGWSAGKPKAIAS